MVDSLIGNHYLTVVKGEKDQDKGPRYYDFSLLGHDMFIEGDF